MERLGLDSITQASRSYRAETGHDTERNKPPSRTVTTDRLQARKNGECVLQHTNPGMGQHHYSWLGMKRLPISAVKSADVLYRQLLVTTRNQVGTYIQGIGGGEWF